MTDQVPIDNTESALPIAEDKATGPAPTEIGPVVELNHAPQEVVEKVAEEITPEQAAAETKKDVGVKISPDTIRYTPDGIAYRLHPVAANLIREAQSRIPDATIRTFTNPTTGKEEENPAHPEYIAEQKQVENKRINASMSVMILFGLELVDPIPADNSWLHKLYHTQIITEEEKIEALSEDGVFLRELFYKNYIVSDLGILNEVSAMSGVTKGDIAKAKKSFQRSP